MSSPSKRVPRRPAFAAAPALAVLVLMSAFPLLAAAEVVPTKQKPVDAPATSTAAPATPAASAAVAPTPASAEKSSLLDKVDAESPPHAANLQAGAPRKARSGATGSLRCWQEGRVVYEGTDLVASEHPGERMPPTISFHSTGRPEATVQVYDLQRSTCVLETNKSP